MQQLLLLLNRIALHGAEGRATLSCLVFRVSFFVWSARSCSVVLRCFRTPSSLLPFLYRLPWAHPSRLSLLYSVFIATCPCFLLIIHMWLVHSCPDACIFLDSYIDELSQKNENSKPVSPKRRATDRANWFLYYFTHLWAQMRKVGTPFGLFWAMGMTRVNTHHQF